MQNTGLDESQSGFKSAGRNIYNLRYADDTTLMAESKEELKSLLKKVKEESEKAGLKLNTKSWTPFSNRTTNALLTHLFLIRKSHIISIAVISLLQM